MTGTAAPPPDGEALGAAVDAEVAAAFGAAGAHAAQLLGVPEDIAREAGAQIERAVDDQIAVLRAVTEVLARVTWEGHHRATGIPWDKASAEQRTLHLGNALATASKLLEQQLLAPQLPGDTAPQLLGYVPAALYGDEWRINDPGQITPRYESACVQAHLAQGFNDAGRWSWGPADDIAVVSVHRIRPEEWKK